MLLFQKRFHEGLVSGAVTVTFRRWEKPHVRVGGRYRCHPIGVLEVDRIDRVTVRDITEDDAKRSGFPSRSELVEFIRTAREEPLSERSPLYRVELHYGGDGDRVEIALDTALSAEDVDEISAKLARMDAGNAWTKKTMALIDAHPRVAASRLAAELGRETLDFKADVRKLKRLGLTQSFEVGYEISPRGRAYLEARARKSPARKKK
ncbi:MAG TPA: ASCH domain-containing protein [Labilithrix sp.]|nr:ASCH domain-containing protein [Labilithrix sp.]